LIPNPIHKVLSTLSSRQVRHLLMGGQACVFYGAAEFSRDTDIAVFADPANLDRLSIALADLQAECIAVPPLELEYLLRGHAVHFRAHHPEAEGMRIDVMSVMRGVDAFDELWQRRTTLQYGSDSLEVISLPDLVAAKKTQRDKDWPMIRRLVEANYVQNRDHPTTEQIRFWLEESRTPEILLDLAAAYPDELTRLIPTRPLLTSAESRDRDALANELEAEEKHQRQLDRDYWTPLRAELEQLRHQARS
jgi:hypothetical protein